MLFDVTFDLDGVIADTFKANQEAYRSVGVEMPDWAWGLPASAWLTDHSAHTAKQAVYLRHLMDHLVIFDDTVAFINELRLLDKKRVGVITNASFRSASEVLGLVGVEVDGLLCGAKVMDLANTRPYCHIDDQVVLTDVPVVPFTGDGKALRVDVKKRLQ